MRALESREDEKCSSLWGRPSSKMRSSAGLRSWTGRPRESTAVAERVTSSARAGNWGTWPHTSAAARARARASRPSGRGSCAYFIPNKPV